MPDPHSNDLSQLIARASDLHRRGQLVQAEAVYRQILARHPNIADAHNNLALCLSEQGRPHQAIAACRTALQLNPHLAHAHFNLANALQTIGDLTGSIASFRTSIALNPNLALAHNNLGNALKDQGDLSAAIASYRAAIHLNPNISGIHNNLGVALAGQGDFHSAITAYCTAVQLDPNNSDAHTNLGVTLSAEGNLKDAIAAHRAAIKHNPNHAGAHNNLGNALKDAGEINDAVSAYRAAIDLNPNFAEAHNNLSIAHLLLGNYDAGWEEDELRLRLIESSSSPNFPQYRWDGAPLPNATLLLHSEQGFGDTIQFIRYAPLAARRVARIILLCQPALARLLEAIPGIDTVIPASAPLPSFDFHCPLTSLPRIFQTRLDTIPAKAPYINVDPTLAAAWSARLGPPDGRPRIGLTWAGNPNFKSDRTRSTTLSRLAPLAIVTDATFYSLQKGAAAEQLKSPPSGLYLHDVSMELTDFAQTAALMSQLDLIITTDTSIAHLAGALAKPTWLLLQHIPDWRWLLNRDDSPWYPTMTLFRQTAAGNWQGLIERVAQSLLNRRPF